MSRLVVACCLVTISCSEAALSPDGAASDAGPLDADASLPDADVEVSTLTLVLTGTGRGIVSIAPLGVHCSESCTVPVPAGTPVALLATAAEGSTFRRWEGACTGTYDCTLSVDTAAVTARFDGAWQRLIGGAGSDDAASMARDGTGHLLVAGSFEQTVSFGDGISLVAVQQGDVFIARTDERGEPAWAQRIGGSVATTYQVGPAMIAAGADGRSSVLVGFRGAVDVGDDALVASTASAFVAQLTPDGAVEWSRTLSPSGAGSALAVARGELGETIVLIELSGTVDLGGEVVESPGALEPRDRVLAVYEPAEGTLVWFRHLQDSASNAIAAVPGGGVLLAGELPHLGAYHFGGPDPLLAPSSSAFLVRYGAAGEHLWSTVLSSDGSWCAAYHVSAGPAGLGLAAVSGLYQGPVSIGGSSLPYWGDADIFAAVIDLDDGTPSRATAMLSGGSAMSGPITLDSVGTLTATGTFDVWGDLGGDYMESAGPALFVVRYAADGSHLSSDSYSTNPADASNPADERISGVAVDEEGNVFLAGRAWVIDFLGDRVPAAGLSDAFLANVRP